LARILVVDDEVEMCNFFKFFLEGKEHEIEVAQNGVQARDALQEYFHLVLLDLKLPDTNGITLLKEIKNRYPTTEVVMMTGYSTVKSAVEAIQLGAYDYLEKPFENLDALEAVFERWNSEKRSPGSSGNKKLHWGPRVGNTSLDQRV
jgi:two-component system NtrC family response regulator